MTAANPPALTWAQIVSDSNAPPPPLPPLDTGKYPFGINGFSWELGGDEWMGDPTRIPSSIYSAMTGWFIIYQKAVALHGAAMPTVPGTVFMRNAQGHVHFKTGGWAQLQFPTQTMIVAQLNPGQTFQTGTPAEFDNADGTHSWPSAPAGSINHGWPIARGSFATGTVDGVYWSFEMRVDTPGMNLIAANGVDWWQNANSGPATNTGYSQGNWEDLSDTQWKLLTGTSLPLATLQSDPPPPLVALATPPAAAPPLFASGTPYS